jgi:hypothetical protein
MVEPAREVAQQMLGFVSIVKFPSLPERADAGST